MLLPKKETKSKSIAVRLTPSDYATFDALAQDNKISISSLILELAKLQASTKDKV